MKTIIFAGGGTAGHIEPALAVADQWMKENPADKCIFIGTSQGLETTLVPAAGFTLRTIKKVVLARRFSPGVLLLPLNLLQAVMQARLIIKGSSLLIGFGGDRGFQEPDRMDIGIGHLQGPSRVNIGQLEGAVIARFAMGGIGQMEGDWPFFALGVDDGEAGVDGRGGACWQGALRDVDAD